MAELRLRRRPSITVKKPTRGKAGIPRIPTPKMAGEADIGALVRAQVSEEQNARWSEAKLAASRLMETNPIGAAQFWLDFLQRELREHPDLYPEGSAERANIQAEILSAQQAVTTTQTGTEAARTEAELAAGGLTTTEQITLLKKKLKTLTPGTEEYYNTLAQIRELEEQERLEAEAAGKKGAAQAWNDYVDEFDAKYQGLNEAYQAGTISGAEYDKQMATLLGEYISRATKEGKNVPEGMQAEYSEAKKRGGMDPSLVLDIWIPTEAGHERARTTKAMLSQSKLGALDIGSFDPTTGQSSSYNVLVDMVRDEAGIESPAYINPDTGQWTTTIKGPWGKELNLSSIFEGGVAGQIIGGSPWMEKDPATGKETEIGRVLFGFGESLGEGMSKVSIFTPEGEEGDVKRTEGVGRYSPEELTTPGGSPWKLTQPGVWAKDVPTPSEAYEAEQVATAVPMGQRISEATRGLTPPILKGPPSAQPVQPVPGYQPGLYPAEGKPTALAKYKPAPLKPATIKRTIAPAIKTAGATVARAVYKSPAYKPKVKLPRISRTFQSATKKAGASISKTFASAFGRWF